MRSPFQQRYLELARHMDGMKTQQSLREYAQYPLFRCAGVDPSATEYDNNGQPLPIAHEDCAPIKEVMA